MTKHKTNPTPITKEDYVARTIAIAKGEYTPDDGETKLWVELMEEVINSPAEVVPEINSQEDLDEWLSKGKVTINDFTKEELQSAFRTLDESRANRNYDKLKDIKLEGDKIFVDKCTNKD